MDEAHALDSRKRLVNKFRGTGDHASASLVDRCVICIFLMSILHWPLLVVAKSGCRICLDEERHVQIGVRWFQYLCEQQQLNPAETFRAIRKQFSRVSHGKYDIEARDRASMPRDWYM